MNDTITFYYHPMSRGRIAHWMLEEVGAKYETKILDFEKKEHKTPAYLKINPMGKIPAIVHRGTVITETPAICAYLADAFPKAQLAPTPTDPARGTYYRWLFFAAGCFEPALMDRMFGRPDPAKPSQAGYGTYQDTLDALETALEPGPYLLGKQFTAADVYVASQIGYGMMTKVLEDRPSFRGYHARCQERPAFHRFSEQANQLLAEMKKS